MKKFFKALALVLALTLVIGTIPAAAATEDYSMKYKTKKLYVGEKRGWKEENGETVYSKYLSKVSYAKAIIGIADKAEAVDKDVTAKSSDKTVVSTHNKAKRIEAEGIGEATVTYYVGGKEVGSILYKVRKSATNDTVYFNRQITEDTKEVIVGTGYEVSLPRSIDKVQQDTDQRRLYAIDKDGNKVDEKKVIITADAEKERLWTVKFVEEGEYTLVGEAYQSDSYPGTNGKATVTVTASKAKPIDVKQTASNMFQIIFDEGVAAGSVIDENTLETGDIYYFIPNTEAAAPFSLIKKTEIKDNIVTVTMFQDFVSGTEYFVDAAGKVFSFVGTGTGLKDVDSVVITKTSVPSGKNTDLGIKIYNKLGIEITNAINADNVTVEVVSGEDNATMVSATEILFEEAGKSAVVKASVFIGYDEANDYKEIIVPSEPTAITSYNGAAVSTGSKDSITADPNKYIGKDSTETKWFAIGDTAYLQTITLMSEGDPKNAKDSGYEEAKSADENICVVVGYNPDINNVELVGIKPGTTQIVYYKADANGNMNAVHAATVTVKPKRTPSSIDAKFSQALLNIDNAADNVTLEVTVKDQYDALYKGADIVVTQNKNNENANGALVLAGGKTDDKGVYKFVVDRTVFPADLADLKDSKGVKVDLASAKQYLYEVKIKDTNFAKTVRFTAQAAGTAATGYTLNVSELALDTSVLVDTEAKTSTISVSGTKNGYKTGDMKLNVIKDALKKGDAVASGTGIYVVVKDKSNNSVLSETDFIKFNDYNIKVTNLVADTSVTLATGGALVKKLDAGNYTVIAQYVEVGTDNKVTSVKSLGTKTIKVSDAQINPTFTKLADKGANASACFEFAFNGSKDPVNAAIAQTLTPSFDVVVSSNKTNFVKTATVYVQLSKMKDANGDPMYLKRTIDINKVIDIE